jgi:hypothetical protein
VCVSPSLPLSLSNVLVSSLSQPRSNCFNFSGGGSSMLRIPHPRAGKWRRAATLLSPAAAEPVLPPLAQLTVEQSVAWLGTVSGLAPDAIEAGGSFVHRERDRRRGARDDTAKVTTVYPDGLLAGSRGQRRGDCGHPGAA